MVAQKAVGVSVSNGCDVLGIQFEKIGVIVLFTEDVFPINASVIDVVDVTML